MSEKFAKPRTAVGGHGDSSTENDLAKITRQSSASWLTYLSLCILSIAVGIALSRYAFSKERRTVYTRHSNTELPTEAIDKLLGSQGAFLFKSLDINKDGILSSAEFGPIVEKLTGVVCQLNILF